MEVHYASNKDEKIFTNERLIKKHFSNDYIKIINRLSELRAANHLGEIPEVPPPRRHKLKGNYDSCWGIDYSKNDRFIIEPYGTFDMYDLTSIVAIKIISLEDYH